MIGFGRFSKERENLIVSLDDERLIYIDPNVNGFYDKVLNHITTDDQINNFIEAIREVQGEALEPFWKPIYDPVIVNNNLIFKAGEHPEVGKSFDFWEQKTKEISSVEGKKWNVGSEYQYYAFLVWLINKMVDTDWKLENAINAIVKDSKELGHYCDSKAASSYFEVTGKREICGVYDLANTMKILRRTNSKYIGFWTASGMYRSCGCGQPLANLENNIDKNQALEYGVGWLVLC